MPTKTLLALFAFTFSLNAQTISISEGKPVSFKYDYDGVLPSRIYVDGAQAKHFSVSELTVTTNAVGAIYTIKVTLAAGLPRGQRTVTARVVDTDGTESDDSNALAVKVKPKAPFGLSALF